MERAVSYLSMPRKTAMLTAGPLAALADSETGGRWCTRATRRAWRVSGPTPSATRGRLFANALVNVAWRNGPVDDVHAGRAGDYPVGARRVTPAEERELMRFASDGMALGMTVCLLLNLTKPRACPRRRGPQGGACPPLETGQIAFPAPAFDNSPP